MKKYLFIFSCSSKELYSETDDFGFPTEIVGIPYHKFENQILESSNALWVEGDDLKEELIQNLSLCQNPDAHGDVISSMTNKGIERWEYVIYEMVLVD